MLQVVQEQIERPGLRQLNHGVRQLLLLKQLSQVEPSCYVLIYTVKELTQCYQINAVSNI